MSNSPGLLRSGEGSVVHKRAQAVRACLLLLTQPEHLVVEVCLQFVTMFYKQLVLKERFKMKMNHKKYGKYERNYSGRRLRYI